MALETIFTFLDIWWPLSGENAWDVDGISRRGTDMVKMRNKSGAHSGTSEVSFHHTEFCLSVVFPFVKFNSLTFHCLEFALMHLIPIDISNNARILEIDDSIVDEKSGSGVGMKNVEVIILDPRTIEIGSRVCTCMEGNGKFRVTTLVSPYKVGVDSNLSVSDITCHLVLPVFVEKDKWVLLRITMVVLAPPTSWMVRVVELLGELRNVGNGTRGRGEGDGRVVCGKPNWFVALHIVI